MSPQAGSVLAAPSDLEVDLLELTEGCAEQCTHCSESPEVRVYHADAEVLLAAVSALVEVEEATGTEVFANYWYPFPASDPFAHPRLAEICAGVYARRGLRGYQLSLGWNRGVGRANAEALCARPESLFRLGITISNFSLLARLNPQKHRERLATSFGEIAPLVRREGPDHKPLVFASPQFVADVPPEHVYSKQSALDLLAEVLTLAGFGLETWLAEGRVHSRPVEGYGRALTELEVTSQNEIQISAETPSPPISRFLERPLSGMINRWGGLEVLAGPRGMLGRERHHWQIERERLNPPSRTTGGSRTPSTPSPALPRPLSTPSSLKAKSRVRTL